MSDAITRLSAALEGRYRIARELGEGGMATVYFAKDLMHGGDILGETFDDPEDPSRLKMDPMCAQANDLRSTLRPPPCVHEACTRLVQFVSVH